MFTAGGAFTVQGQQDLGDGSSRSGGGNVQLQLHSTFTTDLLDTAGTLSRAITGTRGSSYTLGKDPKTGTMLFHVPEGQGYAVVISTRMSTKAVSAASHRFRVR